MRRDATGDTEHLKNPLVAVPDRQDRQSAVAGTKLEREVFDLRAHVGVRELNPFRSARRARGVDDREEVFGANFARSIGGGLDPGGPPCRAIGEEVFQMPDTLGSLDSGSHDDDFSDVREAGAEFQNSAQDRGILDENHAGVGVA